MMSIFLLHVVVLLFMANTLIVSGNSSSISSTSSSSSSRDEEIIDGFCLSKQAASSNLTISCNQHERIAVHEAYFSSHLHHCPPVVKSSHASDAMHPDNCKDDLRLSMNKKCSGQRRCTFRLRQDHPDLKCTENGVVIVRYICIKEANLESFCNRQLGGRFGYVSSPSYPRYYPTFTCSWTIQAEEGQQIRLYIMDAEIREPRITNPLETDIFRKKPITECTDRFQVWEDGKLLAEVCGNQLENLRQIRSHGSALNVTFETNKFTAKRGVLFRYTVQGCPSLKSLKFSHLIHQNETNASLRCKHGFHFNDTLKRDRLLKCKNGVEWEPPLVECSEDGVGFIAASSNDVQMDPSYSVARESSASSNNILMEIIMPIMFLVILLAANVLIVWIIVKIRRRQKSRRCTNVKPDAPRSEAEVPLRSPTSQV